MTPEDKVALTALRNKHRNSSRGNAKMAGREPGPPPTAEEMNLLGRLTRQELAEARAAGGELWPWLCGVFATLDPMDLKDSGCPDMEKEYEGEVRHALPLLLGLKDPNPLGVMGVIYSVFDRAFHPAKVLPPDRPRWWAAVVDIVEVLQRRKGQ